MMVKSYTVETVRDALWSALQRGYIRDYEVYPPNRVSQTYFRIDTFTDTDTRKYTLGEAHALLVGIYSVRRSMGLGR